MPEIVGFKLIAFWLCLALGHLLGDALRLCAGDSKPGLGGEPFAHRSAHFRTKSLAGLVGGNAFASHRLAGNGAVDAAAHSVGGGKHDPSRVAWRGWILRRQRASVCPRRF